jgi:NAD(P)-dependent dehydrogenase (short-subunit alcohol dehydrogenase family)
MQVNLFRSWRMIQAFLPPLKRSAHARIVNVSSGDGSYADPVSPSHSEAARQRGMESAKLLWSALTSTLAAELAATPVIVNAVCPGLTRPTQASSRPWEPPSGAKCGWARVGGHCPATAARWVLPRWIASGPQRPAMR